MITQFPFTLQGLHDWLETQDPSTTYDYTSPSDCLLCRFLKSLGYEEPMVSLVGYRMDFQSDSVNLPEHLNDVSYVGSEFENLPRNYGAAFARAKELLA